MYNKYELRTKHIKKNYNRFPNAYTFLFHTTVATQVPHLKVVRLQSSVLFRPNNLWYTYS